MALSPASDTPGPADKDAAITRLLARVDELSARLEKLEAENFALKAENAALRARVAELEARLGLPPKMPDNSSTPPSQGRKASDDAASKPKGKPHDPAASCSSSSPTATSRRPTTAPSVRCVLAPCSGKSPTAFAPNGEPSSMPTSAPSSKPPAAAPSERSKPSASRWPECRFRTLREPHAATGGLSNYEKFE